MVQQTALDSMVFREASEIMQVYPIKLVIAEAGGHRQHTLQPLHGITMPIIAPVIFIVAAALRIAGFQFVASRISSILSYYLSIFRWSTFL
jgi:hypothetical protein